MHDKDQDASIYQVKPPSLGTTPMKSQVNPSVLTMDRACGSPSAAVVL